MQIPLVELSAEEAASHATKVFWDVRVFYPILSSFHLIFLKIAVEAQSRKCRLNGVTVSSFTSPRPETSTGKMIVIVVC